MTRREFITLLGGGAAAWPIAVRAQQPAIPVVGFVRDTPSAPFAHIVNAFRRGLNEVGFVDGQNVRIEQRWAEGHDDRLPALVADVTRRNAAVIVANRPAALAAKAAATTTPVVFATGNDPAADGLVVSFNRPGGNFTGVVFITTALGAKRLELLRQLVPNAMTIAFLMRPNTGEAEAELIDVQNAAQTVGQRLAIVEVTNESELATAFATFIQRGAGGLIVSSGPFLTSQRERIVTLAAQHRLPTIYPLREFVSVGGAMSYGTSISDAYRQAGIYAGRILKGDKPADLPVMQSTKFDLVLNPKTVKALGLDVPDRLLALADEVIE
jgi:putative tryptophan/tyrosine transport system substrate-binding protein